MSSGDEKCPRQLIDHLISLWSNLDEPELEEYYLTKLVPSLVSDPQKDNLNNNEKEIVKQENEKEIVNKLRMLLTPEEWRALPLLIRLRRKGKDLPKLKYDYDREREKQEKALREAQRREEEEKERLRCEEEEKERVRREGEERKRRDELLNELRWRMRNDFLSVDSFFRDSGSNLITAAEFESQKIAFVKSWIGENTRSDRNGRSQLPDDEQAAAIAAVHGHVQVVARAGSGKTSTLVNRALFLMKHCGVAPSETLLLAFNRKAANSIRRRLLGLLNDRANVAVTAEIDRQTSDIGRRKKINKEEIEIRAVNAVATQLNVTLPHVMTFHALAYAIVHPEESILHDSAEGEAQDLSRVFQRVIDDHLQMPTVREQIRELMLAHFREDWDRIVEGCYDKSKEELLRVRRSLPRESLRGEYVKSFGEKVIANFLFEHDIHYKYEYNHWWGSLNYRPDFTIFHPHKGGTIIEYFGLEGDPDYDKMSGDKRAYWNARKDWKMLEFSPLDITANGVDAFLADLKGSLEEQGVTCCRLSEDEIWNRLRDRAIDRFTKAMVGFIGRCRKRSLSPSDLRNLIGGYSSISSVENRFLHLAHRFYDAYLERLSATGDEDFDGLMQRAAESVASGHTLFERKSGIGDLSRLRYVCIDEFQDFSDLFYRLLSAIRGQNPPIEIFCVGDDWQAINGFAGSDLRFFENFKDYIGGSRRLYISTNYRSFNAIVEVSNALMNGLGKPAISHEKSNGNVLISDLDKFEPSLLEGQLHRGDIITPAILRLAGKALADDLDVVMLCRRNGIPWFVKYEDKGSGDGSGLYRFRDHVRSFFPKGLKKRINISTAHQYKGLEESMVIVLDVVARSYPLIHPDWVFYRILGDSPKKITEEERRLLYVAMTRAVKNLAIITDGRSKSPFLEELEGRYSLVSINWAEYPPIQSSAIRLVVRVRNQDGRGVGPTFAIKDELKAAYYQWQSTGTGLSGWVKSFPSEGFKIDNLKSEPWACQADGVVVEVLNDTDQMVALYFVDKGLWRCEFDNLVYLRTDSLTMRDEILQEIPF